MTVYHIKLLTGFLVIFLLWLYESVTLCYITLCLCDSALLCAYAFVYLCFYVSMLLRTYAFFTYAFVYLYFYVPILFYISLLLSLRTSMFFLLCIYFLCLYTFIILHPIFLCISFICSFFYIRALLTFFYLTILRP